MIKEKFLEEAAKHFGIKAEEDPVPEWPLLLQPYNAYAGVLREFAAKSPEGKKTPPSD